VGGDLDDLDVGGVGRGAGETEAAAGEDGFVLAVELVAVAVRSENSAKSGGTATDWCIMGLRALWVSPFADIPGGRLEPVPADQRF
jgi:hypothetical protein